MGRKIFAILFCLLLIFNLTGCANTISQPSFNSNSERNYPSSDLIAKNESLILEWNSENMGISLTDINTGVKWSSTPASSEEVQYDDFGLPIGMHDFVNSTLAVEYYDKAAKTENIIYSYVGVTKNGHINCEKIENGLKVEYYFDTAEFMIPVEYTLNDGYLSVTINPEDIQENENTVNSVSVLPFWCSAENDSENTYLFVPSGSGALVTTKSVSAQGYIYSEEIYGQDESIEKLYKATDKKSVRLPVYGVKRGNSGSLAVIESGAESVELNISSGSTAYGHSSIYSRYQLRGYTVHQSTLFGSKIVNSIIYSDNMISTPLTIRYYLLAGDNAGYSGMAQKYKEYLINNHDLELKNNSCRMALNFIGGTMITKSFLGVPYSTLFETTTVDDVKEIVEEISGEVNKDIYINLTGFGTTGIDSGNIAGGYKLHNRLGNIDKINELTSVCKKKQFELFVDFDVVKFSSSGNGFSTFFDNASTAGEQKVFKQLFDKAVRDPVEGTEYKLLAPTQFVSAVEKLKNSIDKWDVKGIALSTLSSVSYSDYSNRDNSAYYAKSNFGATVKNALKTLKDEKLIASSDANEYAAIYSDIIFDTPTESSKEHMFLCDVPFYQMVFSGIVPMSTESINLSVNPEKQLLQAVESGTGISYTLISNWDNSLIDANYPYFVNGQYLHLKDEVIANYIKLSDYYEKIEGSHIKSHEILSNGVRKTLFENGIAVYVNYTNEIAHVADKEIAALDFIVLEDAA